MPFLHPLFLLGLGAVSVPVVIHLVFRAKAKVLRFPSVRFLREIERRVARRKKVEELLVLAARCAALALLALALAGPVFRRGGGVLGASGNAVVVVLDDSYSMELRDAEGPVFARARGVALSILRTLGPGDAACVLTSRREPVLTRDLGALATELGKIEPSAGAGTLRPLVEAGLALLEKTDAVQRELYVVSDFQRRASDLAGLGGELRDGTVVLVPVTPSRREHVALVALDQLSPFATTAVPVRVRATLANRGSEPATRSLKLRVDDRVVAEELVPVAPGGVASRAFAVPVETPGGHVVSAELEADALATDARRLLAVDARARQRVLVLRPEADGARCRSFYLERALDPGGAAETGIEVVARDGNDDVREELDRASCVFLVEGVPRDEETRAALARWVARGRGLVVVAGPDESSSDLDALSTAGGELGPLVPARLTGETLAGDGRPDHREAIREVDAHHPVFARLLRGGTPVDLGSASFFRVPRVEALEARGARVLARYASGSPAIVERPYGLGRTILIASSLHTDATNLPLRVGFAPLVTSLLAYLSVPERPEGLLVGDHALLRLAAEGAPETARLRRRGGESREAPRELKGGLARYDFGPIATPGVFDFEWLGSDRIESSSLAANVDPDESVLDYADPAKVLPGARLVTGAEDVAAFVAGIRHGSDLSAPLALAALVFVLAEAFLANRSSFGSRLPEELSTPA
jgi:hypothetical protein